MRGQAYSCLTNALVSSSVPAARGRVAAVEVTQDNDSAEPTRMAAPRRGGPQRRNRQPLGPTLKDVTDWNSKRSRQQRMREDAAAKEWMVKTNAKTTGSSSLVVHSEHHRRGTAATASANPQRSISNSLNSTSYSTATNRCDWRFPPLYLGSSEEPAGPGEVLHFCHSAHGRGIHVRTYQQQRQQRRLIHAKHPPSALRPRLLHRNLHGTAYGPITVLDPRDDLVAALDPAQQRIDLLRIASSSISAASHLIQHVSISPQTGSSSSSSVTLGGGSSYGLRSIENGHGLAVGLPTGDFLVYSAETGQQQLRRSAKATTTASQQRHNRTGTHGCDVCGPYWTSRRHEPGPARRYRPSPHWTLPQQWDRYDDHHHHHHQLDALVEIGGWNRRWCARTGSEANLYDEDEPVVVPSRTSSNASWDFCEASLSSSSSSILSSTSLVAAHVGEDYVGVRLAEDRADMIHILVLGDIDKKPAATGVAFCAGGRLLATAHQDDRSNPFAFDDANKQGGVVMLWDLRMTTRPADAILPSFPREAAHQMLGRDAIGTFALDNFHRNGPALELPQLDLQQGSLVCLSPLERAMLCHRLLPGASGRGKAPLATALHVDGIRIDASHDALYVTDVEQHLAERCRRDTGLISGKPRKRAYSQTLERLFDGTLTPSPRVYHDSAEQHPDQYGRHRSAIPIHLEDRYGCSTSVSSLCVSQHPAGRIVGGTCDGDVYVFDASKQ